MTSEPARDPELSNGTTAAQAGAPAPAATQPAQHVVKRTRIGTVWVAAGLFALVLLLLLIFILENGQRVSIGYLGAHGHLPLGVALLLAAVLGVLLVVIPGTGRIIQLRMTARRHRRIDAKNTGAPPAPSPSTPRGPADVAGPDGS
jgi:lipopolysaccharide assembly protein A